MTKPFTPLDATTLRAHKGKSFIGVLVTFLCHDGQGNFFMTQRGASVRDEPDTWDIGAGGVKFGETLVDAVRREIAEEYGATIIGEPTYLGYREAFRTFADYVPTHWLANEFAVLIDPATAVINEPDATSDSGWFTIDTLPTPLHSQMVSRYWDLHRDSLAKILTQRSS